jgi:hypothetical protein
MYCGTKSGRDVDKFKECNLKIKEAQQVVSPLIETPGIHFECKIVHKAPMDPAYLDSEYEKLYPEKDYHTLYFPVKGSLGVPDRRLPGVQQMAEGPKRKNFANGRYQALLQDCHSHPKDY